MGLLKGNNAPYDTFLFRSAARPYFKQTTDDKQDGLKVGADGNKGEALALGPLIRYQLGKVPITAQWQHEIFSDNRTQGNSFWLKAAFRF